MNVFRLKNDKLLRIENGRGAVVRVERGTVWLTQGGIKDVFLKAGESCRIERNGLTLVSTLRGACTALVSLESPAAA